MKLQNTPENITELAENQIFVFGSNAHGNHLGGAARIAVDKFGAIDKQAEGLQGQSYAIITLDEEMQKVSLKELSESIEKLNDFAKNNTDKEFLVTKIGCGIAGFEESDIIPLFRNSINIENIILPDNWGRIQGFKGFDKNMKCRGFQYEENKEYHEDVNPEICSRGFHFCEMPLDVFNYYPPSAGSQYAHVETLGKVSIGEDKVATNKLKVKSKLSIANLFKIHFDLTYNKVRNEIRTSKETQSTTGNYAHSSTTGNEAHSSTTGKNSIASSLGINSKAKASLGNWIVLTEWTQYESYNWNIKEVKTAKIDGDTLKPDTYYCLINGVFTEVEE